MTLASVGGLTSRTDNRRHNLWGRRQCQLCQTPEIFQHSLYSIWVESAITNPTTVLLLLSNTYSSFSVFLFSKEERASVVCVCKIHGNHRIQLIIACRGRRGRHHSYSTMFLVIFFA